MTEEQLELVRTLIRGKTDSIAYRAAKVVLVDGLSQTEACNALNVKAAAVQNGVTRYSTIDKAIREAYL